MWKFQICWGATAEQSVAVLFSAERMSEGGLWRRFLHLDTAPTHPVHQYL